MKKSIKSILLVILSIAVSLLSCTKAQINELDNDNGKTNTLKDFSIILSKALYNEPELRSFIKEESLKQKDYDNDVIYPLVKDCIITNGKSFYDILKQYDSSALLDKIEVEHPILTILVPDWSWVYKECFCPNNWDTSIPDVGVSFCSPTNSHDIFWNGEYAFSMQNGEFSTVPILIVKDNDRLTEVVKTKTGDASTSFFVSDFKNCSLTSTKSYKYYEYDLNAPVATNDVNLSEITTDVKNAYNVVNNHNIAQRDYIYYGITPQRDSGFLKLGYYERLYKIKISPTAIGCFDDTPDNSSTGTDFNAKDTYYLASHGKTPILSIAEMQAKTWGEGAIELVITIDLGPHTIKKGLSIPFADAFAVKKVKLRESFNFLGALKSRLYYIEIDNKPDTRSEWLESKWIDVNLDLFSWDISRFPRDYYINFMEHDEGTTYTSTRKRQFTFMKNFKRAVDVSVENILKIGAESGSTATVSSEKTYSETRTQQDDNLMDVIVSYNDKIILSKTSQKAKIKTYSTGYVDAMILPYYE